MNDWREFTRDDITAWTEDKIVEIVNQVANALLTQGLTEDQMVETMRRSMPKFRRAYDLLHAACERHFASAIH